MHGLDELLQAALRIFDILNHRQSFRQRTVEVSNYAAGFVDVAVEIDGADERFHCVTERRRSRATARCLFARAQSQAFVERDFTGKLGEESAVDEQGAPLAQHSFTLLREKVEQLLGD